MLRRALPIAARFTPALAPALYLQLSWTLPATPNGQELAQMLTAWYVIACVVLMTAARYLVAPKAER